MRATCRRWVLRSMILASVFTACSRQEREGRDMAESGVDPSVRIGMTEKELIGLWGLPIISHLVAGADGPAGQTTGEFSVYVRSSSNDKKRYLVVDAVDDRRGVRVVKKYAYTVGPIPNLPGARARFLWNILYSTPGFRWE